MVRLLQLKFLTIVWEKNIMDVARPSFGVFGQEELRTLVHSGRIIPGPGFLDSDIKPASIDISITDEIYRAEILLQPSQLEEEKIEHLLPFLKGKKMSLGDIIEPGNTYLARANVSANFPPGIYGYFNAKSSSGRNFLLARTLVDEMHMFDSVDKRHTGFTCAIWMVLQPLVFPFILTANERYNQLRMFNRDTRFKQENLDALLREHDLLYRRTTKEPYQHGELKLQTNDGTVLCTLHAPAGELVGYRAKHTKRPLNLMDRDLDPREYFDPVYAERIEINGKKIDFVRIEGGRYYLFSTSEMIKIPITHTAELVALDVRNGLFFTHFAGFFDPGFFGTATLEVMPLHDMVLRDRQPVARFVLESLASPTSSYADASPNYQLQVKTQLPKQFAPWPA